MQNDLDHENRIMTLAKSTYKVNVLREQLKNASIQLDQMSKELLLVKGQNFEINKRLIRIVDAPYANYTLQLIDGKMKPIPAKLNEVLDVKRSLAIGLQGGDEGDEDEIPVNKDKIPKVNLSNPYKTWKMAKSDAAKAILEKMKNLREVKIS